jgi:hypothetical protein
LSRIDVVAAAERWRGRRKIREVESGDISRLADAETMFAITLLDRSSQSAEGPSSDTPDLKLVGFPMERWFVGTTDPPTQPVHSIDQQE